MTRLLRPAAPLAAVILLLAACGGTPKASALTDPTAILTAAASKTAEATPSTPTSRRMAAWRSM